MRKVTATTTTPVRGGNPGTKQEEILEVSSWKKSLNLLKARLGRHQQRYTFQSGWGAWLSRVTGGLASDLSSFFFFWSAGLGAVRFLKADKQATIYTPLA